MKGKGRSRRSLQTKTDLMGLPLAALFLAIYALPFLLTGWYSLQENRFSRIFVGLSNYAAVWGNGIFQRALTNTAAVTLGCVAASMLLALAVCYGLQYKRRVLTVCAFFLLPMLLPSIFITTLWKAVFQTSSFSGDVESYAALLTLYLWKHAGAAAALILVGLKAVPAEIQDAARLDGASEWQLYLRVSLPCARMHTSLGLTLLIMFALRVYKESYLLFGEYPNDRMYMIQHYMSNHFLKMRFQNVAVAAVTFVAFALMIYGAAYRLGRARERRRGA